MSARDYMVRKKAKRRGCLLALSSFHFLLLQAITVPNWNFKDQFRGNEFEVASSHES
jgi:hypothetical protein